MSRMEKVVLLDPVSSEFDRRWREDLKGLDATLLLFQQDAPDLEMRRDALSGASVLLTRSVPVDRQLLEACGDSLRAVVKLSRWPTGIDVDACRAVGVEVHTIPQLGCIAVAEHAMALMLACAREIVPAHLGTKSGAYRDTGRLPERTTERSFAFKWLPVMPFELFGKTLGIVGLGEIGKELALRARAFDMRVIYHDITSIGGAWEDEVGVSFVALPELLGQADFVSLHVPHTPATEGLIGRSQFELMKPTSCLINAARGGLVDEEALVWALQAGQIAGAGLDVFVDEPLPHDHPLTDLDNVVLTCHIGGGSGEGRSDQARRVREAILASKEGVR